MQENAKRVVKRILIFSFLLVLIAPVFFGYIVRFTNPELVAELVLSIYGIYSIINFVIQVITAGINNYKITQDVKQRTPEWNDIRVGILVVGYREDPFMFKKCLESFRDSEYKNIARKICVIDGTDDDDKYMADIYANLYQTNVIKIDYLLSDKKDDEKIDFEMFGGKNEDICIMQPHKGKREALYTGFKILMNDPSIDAIFTTDSDTILDKNAVREMVYQLRHEDIGAVAGQITVWNTNTLLTFIVSMRYWFSFNLERACDSFFRCVMCVAGPMACYKVSVLKDIVDPWLHQRFLGMQCTYGDDRHLTNQILSTGKRVIYTQYAVGHTDTPESYVKYLNQQTRWGKSYFREIFYTFKCIDKQSIWIGWELLYHTLYFFLLMFWTMYLLWFTNINTMAFAILIMTAFGLFKSVYGVVMSRDPRFMFFFLYSYVYYFVLIPSKIAALLTMMDSGWGTRGTFVASFNSYFSTIISCIWFLVLSAGFGYNIYKSHEFNWYDTSYRFAFLTFMSYLAFLGITMIIYIICQYNGKLETEVYRKLKKERADEMKENTSETVPV